MFKIFQTDAFTSQVFDGNPAAVVPLEHWIDDTVLQSIAAENNLAETAFLVPIPDGWELRWFTPTTEVALCGHATLAAAHVLVTELDCTNRSLLLKVTHAILYHGILPPISVSMKILLPVQLIVF